MKPPQNISITGATGFLGPYVIKAAIAQGYAVKLLVRNPAKVPADLSAKVQILKGHLSDIPPSFTEGADVVLHMAALIKAPSRSAFYAVNAGGTKNLAAQAQSGGAARFIYLSSQAASQPHLSGYAASKQAGETALQETFTRERVIIRAPAVFGPGDEATAPFFTFMKRGLLPVPGGKGWAERKLSLIYAPDLARFIAEQIAAPTPPLAPLYPASVASLTWRDFAGAASEVMGREIKPLPLPLPLLKTIAGVNSALLRRAFNPHLTLGKLSEFLYEDWSVDSTLESPTSFKTALRETFSAQI